MTTAVLSVCYVWTLRHLNHVKWGQWLPYMSTDNSIHYTRYEGMQQKDHVASMYSCVFTYTDNDPVAIHESMEKT